MNTSIKLKKAQTHPPSPTDTPSQSTSPIVQQAPALNSQECTLTTREVGASENTRSKELSDTLLLTIKEDDLRNLVPCVNNLIASTPEIIASALLEKTENGQNFFMLAIQKRSVAILQLVLPLCQKLGETNPQVLQQLLSQQDKSRYNFFMLAISSRNKEVLELVLPLCQKLGETNPQVLQQLLSQRNKSGHNFLMLVASCFRQEIPQLVLPLFQKLGETNPQVLQQLLSQRNKSKEFALQIGFSFNQAEFILSLYSKIPPQNLVNDILYMKGYTGEQICKTMLSQESQLTNDYLRQFLQNLKETSLDPTKHLSSRAKTELEQQLDLHLSNNSKSMEVPRNEGFFYRLP